MADGTNYRRGSIAARTDGGGADAGPPGGAAAHDGGHADGGSDGRVAWDCTYNSSHLYWGSRSGRWWGGHYTRHARTDSTTQPANAHNPTTATPTVSTAVGHHGHGHLVLNGGQCGIAAEIVTMPFARESGQGGWCAGGLGKSGLSANASMAVTCGRGRGLHFRLLSG